MEIKLKVYVVTVIWVLFNLVIVLTGTTTPEYVCVFVCLTV